MKKPKENIVLENEDLFCKSLNIGITVDDIMAEVNAFDWLEMKTKPAHAVLWNFQQRLKFDNPAPSKYWSIREKAFAYLFERALVNLNALIEEVHSSYNFGKKGGINNAYLDQYYYIKYWGDKKLIAIDYNETDYNKRKLFNFYTILFDIFAVKLENYNSFINSKTK
jgi:hypothetical protein